MNDEASGASASYRSDPHGHRSGNLTVIAIAIVALSVTVYFALGMPGMDHGNGSTMVDMDMTSATPAHRLVDPDGFAAAVKEPGAVLINVHVPYEGEIEGTDLLMPFDEIDPVKLPTDRSQPILVYCRSGTMSATAVTTLTHLGYSNLVELKGGMQAWRASGRTLTMHQGAGQA